MTTRIARCTLQKSIATLALGSLLFSGLAPFSLAQDVAKTSSSLYTFKAKSELVLVSVTARDKKGNIIRDLKQSDFTVLEDGKAQHIQSFDIEDAQNFAENNAGPEQIETTATAADTNFLTAARVKREGIRDRRLIVLFFDLSSMEVDEVQRAMNSARNYVDKQMAPADLVAVVSYATSLQVLQDFTSDHAKLKRVFDSIEGIEGEGMQLGTTASDATTVESGQSYSTDDTEYNIFNTDLRLQALASVAETLARLDQKKAILYFSSGMTKTGTDNQAQLRAAINTAVKANVSIYPVDSRGLQAMPAGGSADTASLRGTSAYSGAGVQSQLDSNFASQETLTTMAADTGGKAFLDTNDFGKAFDKVQADTSTYYVIGYRSTNPAMDGHFRRITVKSNRSDLKLEYRRGYYGPRDFKHYTKDDRERQLEDEMTSDLPSTDLPVYLSTEYFRSRESKYYTAVSIVVPGSAIPFIQSSDKDKATLDIMGMLREKDTKIPVGQIRETVKLNIDGTQEVRRKNVQYNTGFLLLPGTYHLKFIVRENQNGQLGSFETDIVIPDLSKKQLKMSTVVLASQKQAAPKKSQSPLVSDGQEIIPSVSHVFTTEQPMLLYYEVYEPSKLKAQSGEKPKGDIKLLTSIQFFKGKVKVYESPLVEADTLNAPDRKAAAFQFEVPTSALKPGWYTCQVNVIDDAGGTFAFPRTPMLLRATEAVAPKTATGGN